MGPVTANGVDLLTKIYVIYMEANPGAIGPTASGALRTEGRKEN